MDRDSTTLPSAAAPGPPTPTNAASAAAAEVILNPGRRWPLLLERVTSLALILCATTALVIWREPATTPVDLPVTGLISLCIAALVATIGLPWRYLLRPRTPVPVTREGIHVDGGLVRWSEITTIDVVAAPGGGRRLELRLHHKRTVRLWSLTAGYPVPDRTAAEQIAQLAAAATAHRPEITVRTRTHAFLITTMVGLLLIFGGIGRTQERGLIGPWTPTVPASTTACQVLDSVALQHTFWPYRHTVAARRDTYGVGTSCIWETVDPAPGGSWTPALARMTLRTTVHGWHQLRSPVAAAARTHANVLGTMPTAQPLPHMPGSNVVLSVDDESVYVVGQRSNVRFEVRVDCNGAGITGCPSIAVSTATGITYWVLLGIGP